MDSIPIAVRGLLMAAILLLAVEIGWRVHGWMSRRRGTASGTPSINELVMLVGGSMTLLSLLIGFTVSLAAQRFEYRRQLVVDEANAISTTYLRAQLVAEPVRSRLTSLIAQYARDRAIAFHVREDSTRLARAYEQADVDQKAVWQATADAIATPGGATLTTAILFTTNQMFDLAAAGRAALENRVPRTILIVLIIYPIVTAFMVGFALRAGGRRYPGGSALFFVMVTVSILLIIDLDHPTSGVIVASSTALDRVTATIAKSELAKIRPKLEAH